MSQYTITYKSTIRGSLPNSISSHPEVKQAVDKMIEFTKDSIVENTDTATMAKFPDGKVVHLRVTLPPAMAVEGKADDVGARAINSWEEYKCVGGRVYNSAVLTGVYDITCPPVIAMSVEDDDEEDEGETCGPGGEGKRSSTIIEKLNACLTQLEPSTVPRQYINNFIRSIVSAFQSPDGEGNVDAPFKEVVKMIRDAESNIAFANEIGAYRGAVEVKDDGSVPPPFKILLDYLATRTRLTTGAGCVAGADPIGEVKSFASAFNTPVQWTTDELSKAKSVSADELSKARGCADEAHRLMDSLRASKDEREAKRDGLTDSFRVAMMNSNIDTIAQFTRIVDYLQVTARKVDTVLDNERDRRVKLSDESLDAIVTRLSEAKIVLSTQPAFAPTVAALPVPMATPPPVVVTPSAAAPPLTVAEPVPAAPIDPRIAHQKKQAERYARLERVIAEAKASGKYPPKGRTKWEATTTTAAEGFNRIVAYCEANKGEQITLDEDMQQYVIIRKMSRSDIDRLHAHATAKMPDRVYTYLVARIEAGVYHHNDRRHELNRQAADAGLYLAIREIKSFGQTLTPANQAILDSDEYLLWSN